MEDESIVQLLQQGNELAFKEFYQEYGGYFKSLARGSYGYMLAYIPIEDLIDEAFFVSIRAIHEYDQHKNASFKTFVTLCVTRSWLRTYTQIRRIYTNTVSLDQSLVREKKEYTYHDITPDQKAEDAFDRLALEDLYSELINSSNKWLTEENRQIIHLKLMGYTLKEISEEMGISMKKVGNILYKIRKMIKSQKE